jgi:hypothetical protein
MLALFAIVLISTPLLAQIPPGGGGIPQADPSAEKESFVVMPSTVARGDDNVEIRLANNTPSGYSHSSSRSPELRVGAGAELVVGSFAILNSNDARAFLNIDDDTASTISLSIDIFGVNGTTVLQTLQATLGVTGLVSVSGSAASVGADDVKLVRVNSEDDQPAGEIKISGTISGTVIITAPTGTTFASQPTATSTADINSPTLAQPPTTFSFSIGNASSADITVSVSGILYDTQYFSLIGGVEGDLALEITGGALSNQSALVVNAFTAKGTLEGQNDNTVPEPETPEPEVGSEESESTTSPNTNSSSSSGNGNRRSLDSSKSRNNSGNRNNRNSTRSNPPRPASVNRQPSRAAPRAQPGFGRNRNAPRNSFKRSGGGASPIIGKGGPSSGEGDGTAKVEKTESSSGGGKINPEPVKPRKLITAPGLYFTNKEFEPVTAVVMNKFVSDEAGGRIWVVLKKDKNDTAKVESVKVKLTIGGNSRELKLTETSKDSGVFRCSTEGVLIVSNEDPNSNRDEPRKTEPKPRFK